MTGPATKVVAVTAKRRCSRTTEKARRRRAFSIDTRLAMRVWSYVTLRVRWLSSGACLTIVMW